MIEVNDNNGSVIINANQHQDGPGKNWHKGWVKRWRLFGLYFYVGNVRMKKRPPRDILYTNHLQDCCKGNRRRLYERQGEAVRKP